MKVAYMKAVMAPQEDYNKQIESIWEKRWLTSKGDQHQSFLNALKERLNNDNLSLFVNGHLSLETAIEALKLEGEIITTAFTFPSTSHAILRKGCTPVFADIDLNDYTLDEKAVEALINEKTTAILAVHLFGFVCHHDALKALADKHGLKLIYDAAHAFGVKWRGRDIASYGDIAMFSMNATKVFNTIEGGLLAVRDPELIRMLELIKYYGLEKEESIIIGSNLKMNEFQAAMGLVNLKYLDQEIENRKRLVEFYQKELSNLPLICSVYDKDTSYNYAYYPVRMINPQDRNPLYDFLKEKGIESKRYFYPIIPDHPAYHAYKTAELPNSRLAADSVLCLPIYGDLSDDEMRYIVESVSAYFLK